MSARPYTVETRSQAALVIGEGSLAHRLTNNLKQQGIFVVTPDYSLHSLLNTHDLDYLIVLAPNKPSPSQIETLTPILSAQGTKHIQIRHLETPAISLPFGTPYLELVYGDYLGDLEYSSPLLSKWGQSLVTSQSITIPADGLSEISLLSEEDLANGIISALTTSHPPGHQLFLSGEQRSSLLNLAYDIRALLPYKINLNFDLRATPPLSNISLPRYSWQQTSVMADLLSNFIRRLPVTHTPPAPRPQVVSPTPQPVATLPSPPPRLSRLKTPEPVFVPLVAPRKPLNWAALWRKFPRLQNAHPTKSAAPKAQHVIVRGLLLAFALYLGSLAFAATLTALSLRTTLSSEKGSLPPSNPLAQTCTTYLQANFYVLSLVPGLSNSQLLTDIQLGLDSYQQLLQALFTAQSLSQNASLLSSTILGHSQEDLPRLISDSRLQSETLYQQLSLLDGSLPADPPPSLPDRYVDNYSSAKSQLAELKRSVLMSKGILSILPDLIGVGGRRKYGVLFQNNMELRATGGFIGSFAILSFDNGSLYDMPVYDVYAADGALKGHVEPPKPIKEILGEANWYLRDSNFDPDFPTSARRAEWFIQKTLNFDLDGTFALNLESMRALLSITGPLSIPDYGETINAGNLYERSQYHAEVNFFPGSTQKKEFLSAVGNALFNQLSQLDPSQGFFVLNSLLNSLESKDILLSVERSSTEHVLSTLGWNGAVLSPPDSVMVVDSNFGVNKANYYVTKESEMVITLNKDLSISHSLRLRYLNSATSNTWPAGPYKNYSRIILPSSVSVQGITVGNKPLAVTDYTITKEHNRTVLGFLFTVPINSSLGVEVTYQTNAKLDPTNPNYSWYWQKQPGTNSSDPLTVYLNYPLYLKPAVVSPEATVNPQQLQFDFENDMDHRLSVNFTQ